MDQRMNIFGKGQALEDDRTSTGAVCIAGQRNGSSYGRAWLFVGDKTTPCPACGQPGTIIEGEPRWSRQGIPMAVDGSRVSCGCPPGSNYILAPLGIRVVHAASDARQPAGRPAPPPGPSALQQTGRSSQAMSAMAGREEPGFHIVRRSTSFPQLVLNLFDQPESAPVERLKQLNPTFAQGFKAGEIFVIGDPGNGFTCTLEEAQLMEAAELTRAALADFDASEANFMMDNIAEIAGVLNGASQAMGVSTDILTSGLGRVQDTLHAIERLHQQEFIKHGHLKSREFLAARQKLRDQLSAQLRSSLLDKHLSLGRHPSLKKGLGISTKSLVHHWSRAGAPGKIPGYATHLDEVARTAKYLKYGGRVGIGIGAGASGLKIYEACRAGDSEACQKAGIVETASFSGGLGGGVAGAGLGKLAARFVCVLVVGRATARVGTSLCMTGMVGAGSATGGIAGGAGGEKVGEVIYDFTTD